MSYRVLLLVPEGLTYDLLPDAAKEAIAKVMGQFVLPMPGTIPANGTVVVDAITADDFDPATMPDYGITWPIIGMWERDGTPIIPMDKAAFLAHLPPTYASYDPETGAPIGSPVPPVFHQTHYFAGWEGCFG